MSHVDFYEGNLESAYDLQLQSLEIVHELGIWRWGESIKQITLADLASRLARQGDAEAHGLAALSLSRETGDRNTTAFSLASLAVVARARGEAERAGTLWGSIEAEEERMLLGRWAAYGHEYADRVLGPDDPEFELGRRRGRELTLGQAVAFARETGRPR